MTTVLLLWNSLLHTAQAEAADNPPQSCRKCQLQGWLRADET